ncbi:MAG: acetylglutamate kinase [Peptococcaceae bacterium]|nr:acetylglutamate kinase [Peptococcaceae bacterium]
MNVSYLERANILIEALPYIQRFAGHTIVIKYGGHAMVDDELKEKVIQNILLLQSVGMRPVVVHGGGPEINRMLKRIGKKSTFVQGLRVTDEETMEIAAMVLVGKLNTQIVAELNRLGGKAVGLNGQDARLFLAEKKPMTYVHQDGYEEDIDLGYVGQITKISPEIIVSLLDQGYVPVVSPLAGGEDGVPYNVNADMAAGMLAGVLKAYKLFVMTDVPGIMGDIHKPETVFSRLSAQEVKDLMAQGIIQGGMIPKAECVLSALEEGVRNVHIIDGRQPHALILEVFSNVGVGTMVSR